MGPKLNELSLVFNSSHFKALIGNLIWVWTNPGGGELIIKIHIATELFVPGKALKAEQTVMYYPKLGALMDSSAHFLVIYMLKTHF